MQFRPFVYDAANQQVPVAIEPMTPQDAATTTKEPRWQTDWTSEYISKGKFDVYGLKRGLANWWPWELMRSVKMWSPSTLSIWRVRHGTAVFDL